jgi:hypothetical protein
VARAAKQTGRAEARRRYRQSAAEPAEDGAAELDYGERRTDIGAGGEAKRAAAQPAGRPGFGAAFRGAYRRLDLRDDLQHLPQIFLSRGFLLGVALVIVGGAAWYLFPVRTGSALMWELLVIPGSALAPQLVAGFLAPRGSYLMGLALGIVQPIVYVIVNTSPPVQAAYAALGPGAAPATPADQLLTAMISSAVTGTLFASMAAWYRRFLSLSSPRRAPAGRPGARNQGRQAARSSSPRR